MKKVALGRNVCSVLARGMEGNVKPATGGSTDKQRKDIVFPEVNYII